MADITKICKHSKKQHDKRRKLYKKAGNEDKYK